MNYLFCLITDEINPLFTFLYEHRLATYEHMGCKYKIYVGKNQIDKNNLTVNYYTSIVDKNSYWIPSESEDIYTYKSKIQEIFNIIFSDIEKDIIYKHFDILLDKDDIKNFLQNNKSYYALVYNTNLYLFKDSEIYSFNLEQKVLDENFYSDIMNNLKNKVIQKYSYEEELVYDYFKKVSSFLGIDSLLIKLFLLGRDIFISNG